jgi:type VI secretion system lysozyme-like protein
MEPRYEHGHVGRHAVLTAGLAAPLFDRFDEELDDSRVVDPYRVQNLSLLLESVRREIDNLLNTRVPPRGHPDSAWQPRSMPQTVIDYGLPAFSALDAASPADADLLNSVIVGKIAAFEPRLRNPVLELRAQPDNPSAMVGLLRGVVQLEGVTQSVGFEVYCDHHGEFAKVVTADGASLG